MFVLRGLDQNGVEKFYTGGAGQNWLTRDKAKAFEYSSQDVARQKAKHFNNAMKLHGYWFIAVPKDGFIISKGTGIHHG